MSFRVKVRVKALPNLVEAARRCREAVDRANRLTDYECAPTGCPVCGMKFTDPMGRPIAMGYVCGNPRCPSRVTSISTGRWTPPPGVTYLSWNGSVQ